VTKLDRGKGEGFLKGDELGGLEDKLRQWAEDEALHIVKMHAVHPLAARLSDAGSARLCYVYRDIRDVAASAKRFWGVRGHKLLEAVDAAIQTYCEVTAISNVLSWEYEDLVRDPAARARELAAHLGMEASPDIVSSVVDECSLENAKAVTNGRRLGLPLRLIRLLRRLRPTRAMVYHRDTLLYADHISKTEGRPGTWRQHLDKEESSTISRRYAGWLEQGGYQP
jgi:hypothetical protein